MYHQDLYLQANEAQRERDIAGLHRELAALRAVRADRPRRREAGAGVGRFGGVMQWLRSLVGASVSRA
ncbi:MAG TPA: hypothetical protein VKV26_10570 [Dehalococcoidia bacterium]|nr:hypothetical protein [Dehalococcoidia bacterium]